MKSFMTLNIESLFTALYAQKQEGTVSFAKHKYVRVPIVQIAREPINLVLGTDYIVSRILQAIDACNLCTFPSESTE
jgi:hypothetical protein